MDIPPSSTTGSFGKLAAAKLDQLSNLLGEPEPARAQLSVDARRLAESLFSRAAEDFLRRSSVEALRDIVAHCSAALSEFRNSADEFLILTEHHESGTREGHTTFVICVKDRPFIVDSLSEFFQYADVDYRTFLHPIVKFASSDGSTEELVSLTYVEAEPLAAERRTSVIEGIRETLNAVIASTDDYSAMTQALTSFRHDHSDAEAIAQWLAQGAFVMLGVLERDEQAIYHQLGLLRSGLPSHMSITAALDKESTFVHTASSPFLATKLVEKSPVHRRSYLEVFTFRGEGRRALCVLGMLTSQATNQEILTLPVAAQKVESVLQQEELVPNSQDYKEAISALNVLPTFILFRAPVGDIRENLRVMMAVQPRSETRVHVHPISFERLLSLSVIMPKRRYSSDLLADLQELLCVRFGISPSEVDSNVVLLEDRIAAIFLLIPKPSGPLNETELMSAIADQAATWDDQLFFALYSKFGSADAPALFDFYTDIFPDDFRAHRSARDAVADIEQLESLSDEHQVALSIASSTASSDSGQLYDLRIYKYGGGLTLSLLLPLLENSGFHILDERVTNLLTGQKPGAGSPRQHWASIYALLVKPRHTETIYSENIQQTLLPALEAVLKGETENDSFNALLTAPVLSIREVALCRTWSRYLWQIKASASEGALSAALVENPDLARMLVNFFTLRFDPNIPLSGDAREAEASERKLHFIEKLKGVSSLAHDRALRAFWNLIESTVRTNYFQGEDRYRISLKIQCSSITQMPRPRPLFEIFVCSPEVEGVHLRMGKVARGGLRWSERPEDYRTEILGLSKTQQVKNVIIVPVGAKGGFVVKGKGKPSYEEVTQTYRTFIRSLLEITDNRSGENVSHPKRSVIYDGPDPYFVVAADKGTAAFSDIANEIAENEFGLWIGDAFASGGSRGYSHKKYGITARGAWEAVCVHFRELGIDLVQNPISVVGIGDMSGDVFGNGLILSEHVKLLAAFDHRHIFIDPAPDTVSSFAERVRLFELPRSSWTDYNPSLISHGGGVFPRESKAIPLNDHIRRALAISPEHQVVSGQELIQMILRAPADLLWNGGIGTYVKASFQDDSHAADRANDDVRISADELRVRTVGEGGNLGFTQQARIEYSLRGGRMNTDAIDNSGGVDLSDHEVNLKILLSAPVARGELSVNDRTALLMDCVEAVCDAVVTRNRAQSTALSLITEKSYSRMQFHLNFIRRLEKEGILDRKSEALPDDETLLRRGEDRRGLTRPEAAVLLAHAKMSMFARLVESDIPDDPTREHLLFSYFPAAISSRFSEDVRNHPLRKEIIATQIVNTLFEWMDPSFIYRLSEEIGASEIDVVDAFLSAWELLDASWITDQLMKAENAGNASTIRISSHRLSSALYGTTRWLLKSKPIVEERHELIHDFRKEHQILLRSVSSFLPVSEFGQFERLIEKLSAAGFTQDLAIVIASLSFSTPLLEVVDVAQIESVSSTDVAKLYAQVSSELHVAELLQKASKVELTDYWDMTAWHALLSDLRMMTGDVVRSVFATGIRPANEALEQYFARHADALKAIEASVREFEKRPLTLGALSVLTARLRQMVATGAARADLQRF